ncbi:transcription-repair coupling factor [Caloranaerobacter sp. TR13]|uniref:transcription-repair coupling factor n=1 Tax=Caloranaerobacter sp. TR13 TaxID=1302151 RepID=UPI0006D44CA8|nr:transcription-repair coupling factor [Caloranaerobacter sp. TR13]KPU26591.1 transcription-repair coupling factor [Caloranaerobacter sp. TR13]
MPLNVFTDQLKNLNQYSKLIEAINTKRYPVSLYGLSEESLAHICYGLNQHTSRQVLIVTYNELRAKKIVEDLRLFSSRDIELFPQREVVFYNVDAYSHGILHQRLNVIDKLIEAKPIIVVASIESIMDKVFNKEILNKYRTVLKYGDKIDLEKLIKNLNILGYERVDMIEGKGQFSVRGGIVDFYPITLENPVRVELFDDEIDSLRTFDIKTQRSIQNISEIKIGPAKEIIFEDEYRKEVVKQIENDLTKAVKKIGKEENSQLIVEKLTEKFTHYIELINSGLNFDNIEPLIPYFPVQYKSIVDYFDKSALMLIDEPNRIEENAMTYLKSFRSKFLDFFERGEVLPKQEGIYYNFDELKEKLNQRPCIMSMGLRKGTDIFESKETVNITTKGMQSFHNKIEFLVNELRNLKYRGYKTIILSGVEDRGKRLVETLKEYGVECSFIKTLDVEIKSGQIFVLAGTISRGFEYPDLKFAIISDKEIYGKSKRKRAKQYSKDTKKITSFTDLKPGDYVVHETHGIGVYVGIEQLKVQGVKKDYLSIKYSGKDRLYVPVDQMDLIQKYIGADSIKPKVNKLGTGEWVKTKQKAKKAIENMAKELLELYAKRQTTKGFAFSTDQPWQKQFEDLFPYEETNDQLKCIEEIKRDMEKDKPMDRLLCGDVGYGKTEVALRAAFKAVMDGKQVAFLVPTTILAQQHYNTIRERFSQFPVKVDMLSRFRTPSHQKKILRDLRSGNLDIVVGTHRLLSSDVKFKDLGLLIIDEEQRFGVKHKEALKKLKESIDVLTLTATPIPRTLHMALVGIRDMSVIDEPPEERYPVQTYVMEYNEGIIRDAIVKELNRDGQVYFVYNRVQGIQQMAAKLKKLVPEARIVVGHGQMNERELEKVMIDFLKREYDILVCTTIIETGLDISNVNTLIVYDSDKMGLSQLYQLRGRVGRSNRIAYAYFTYEKDKALSEVAEKRLKAIKEFTEFGSGFKIAMRDLEIRGAGNLLGPEQHGHMASIGYDLYVKYLEEAIKKLKGEIKQEDIETTIELNVDGYIPSRYIANEEQKIEIYKKISSIQNREDLSDVQEEIIDRFGDIPKEVDNLLKISLIKSMCKRAKISSLTQIDNYIKIEFVKPDIITPQLINELLNSFGRRMSFDISKTPHIKYKLMKKTQESILKEVQQVIQKISSFHEGEIDI